jgi:hypothetical protein
VEDLDRDLLLGEVGSKRGDALLHPIDSGRVVRAHVWRGCDGGDPLGGRATRQLSAVLECSCAVVDAGKHVRIEVDHSGRIGIL